MALLWVLLFFLFKYLWIFFFIFGNFALNSAVEIYFVLYLEYVFSTHYYSNIIIEIFMFNIWSKVFVEDLIDLNLFGQWALSEHHFRHHFVMSCFRLHWYARMVFLRKVTPRWYLQRVQKALVITLFEMFHTMSANRWLRRPDESFIFVYLYFFALAAYL